VAVKEGLWYEKKEDKRVYCLLCPHGCTFGPDKSGKRIVRKNIDGKLIASNYGKAGAQALDPIEKKPLYHFYPGSFVLSVGARGCNFKCEFCQNWQLAQGNHKEHDITPLGLVSTVERYGQYYNVIGLAYTYSEPFMWYEFVFDCARTARQAKLKNTVVTNGFINPGPLEEILPYIDAVNIDVKGFTGEFYREVVHGAYGPVLQTADTAKKRGCHVEITTLLIPGLNDSEQELERLVGWIENTLGKDTPLHFSRYYPNHRMQVEPTPLETLFRARELAGERLHYVYLGNIGPTEASHTYCPECGSRVITRSGDAVDLNGLVENDCRSCGRHIEVVI